MSMKPLVYKDANGGEWPWFVRDAHDYEWSFETWREALDFVLGTVHNIETRKV